MKTTLRSAVCITLVGAGALAAQPSFTKITDGPLVNDLGVMPICPAWGDLNNDGYLEVFMYEGATMTMTDASISSR